MSVSSEAKAELCQLRIDKKSGALAECYGVLLYCSCFSARELRIVYGNDNLGEIAQRQKQLVDGLRSMLGLTAKVTLVAPKSIVRSEGKAVRVIDKRKI